MNQSAENILEKLCAGSILSEVEFKTLLEHADPALQQETRNRAGALSVRRFGHIVYFRSIVEFTNRCIQNCRYCGLRRNNSGIIRYRMNAESILSCCERAYRLGIRTFVLQGGEDPFFTTDSIVTLITMLLTAFPDACITLSLGEKSEADYRRFLEAGASRYLLRHETAEPAHYSLLHSTEQSYWHRMECLHTLKALGFQTGCGMMVGSPGQTSTQLARDLAFMQAFRPHMIGIGPFLPASGTPFATMPCGSASLTLFLLAICRLMLPDVMLPATTALRTLLPEGCRLGILSGCNVLMPDFTQDSVKKNYAIYDGKPLTPGEDSLLSLQQEIASLGFCAGQGKGDWQPSPLHDAR